MKVVKWVIITLGILFVLIQVVRPAKTNPPIDQSKTLQATAQVPPAVAAILDRACYDCHSSRTTWPWYSNVAPISWFLVDHVNEGRQEMSFSEWATYPTQKQGRRLNGICKEVKSGDMPLSSYLILHPEAKLSDADRQTLCDWTSQEMKRLNISPADLAPRGGKPGGKPAGEEKE
jgi:hypothetical protein